MSTGPLAGVRVVELGGMGPGPFGTMMLAEMGADVVRLDRPGGSSGSGFPGDPTLDQLNRGKRSIALDLKQPGAVDAVLDLVERADVVVDPFRPGVAERLGLGPETCFARKPGLVFARMTGWGQDGPEAMRAGHDINYIALTGALHGIGPAHGAPVIPLNLVGDFGGGAVYLVIGVLAALREVAVSGRGQVIDASIVDGAAHLLTGIHGLMASGHWVDERGSNFLDGAAPYYHVYATSEGRHVAVGAIEPKFYAELVDVLGAPVDLGRQTDESTWPQTIATFASIFATRTQQQWIEAFAGRDACASPVRSMQEAAQDPHMAARRTVRTEDGHLVSAAAPRFSLYPTGTGHRAPAPGEHTREVLADWGVHDVDALLDAGVAVQR